MSATVETIGGSILARVRALYEAHPYPRYPLLAKPRWREGYLTHSRFAQAVAGEAPDPHLARGPGERARILIGGSGEVLPYVIRTWEPRDHRVVSLDLSARSLARARVRLLLSPKPNTFVRGDLDDYLGAQPPNSLVHIDAFGVLHHMRDPGTTLKFIARSLAPGGTVRLMVYNASARRWIHHLQRAFALLELQTDKNGIARARTLLAAASRGSPALTTRLRQVGARTLASNARFADLFMHPREARMPIGWWLQAARAAGLTIKGLLDRYGELDDLPNPLWQPPTAEELVSRALDRRFEGNLELYLQRPGGRSTAIHMEARPALPLTLAYGPALWWSFGETRPVSPGLRRRIWLAHMAFVERRAAVLSDRDLIQLSIPALGRLARLGALLPGQIAGIRERAALAPLVPSLEAPAAYPEANAMDASVTELVGKISIRLGTTARAEAALRRLVASRAE